MKVLKEVLKKIVVVLVLISFLFSNSFAQVDFVDELQETLDGLNNFQSQLRNPSNRSGRPAASKISSFLMSLNSAVDLPGTACDGKIRSSVNRLNKAFTFLGKKTCSGNRRTNCISGELVSELIDNTGLDFLDREAVIDFFLADDDGDGVIDICSSDVDGDSVENRKDNCPFVSNPLQKDTNRNRIGDACDLFTCCDSIDPIDSDTCSRKTIKSCRQLEQVIIDCTGPIKKGDSTASGAGAISFTAARGLFSQIGDPVSSSINLFQGDGSTPPAGDGTTGGSTGDSMTQGGDTMAAETQEEFEQRLQEALNMSMVTSMEYGEDYDCDDFAGDLEQELEGQGFMSTFTAIWTDDGSETVPGHALTDVHGPGGVVWVEPQTGEIVDLDEDGDGNVMASDGTHSDEFMASEGMSQIEVYEDKAAAGKAGVPID
jgi:hypothetical protein